MAAFNDVTVLIPSRTATSLKVQVGPETIDVDPQYLRNLVQGRGHRYEHLLYVIALGIFTDNIDVTNAPAVKAYVESKTWKFGG